MTAIPMPQPRSKNPVNVGPVERVASVVGGAALALYGVARGRAAGFGLAAAGGYLVYRGATGHCPGYAALGIDRSPRGSINVERALAINRPAGDLYRFWRRFENLPRFMSHLESVTEHDATRSRWVAKAPAGTHVSWEAEVTAEREPEFIAWRSLPGATVPNSGSVRFEPLPGDRGTAVRVLLEYSPPGGSLGAAVAKLFGEEPKVQIQEDLRRFKAIIEAGEAPTVKGQPAGRGAKVMRGVER